MNTPVGFLGAALSGTSHAGLGLNGSVPIVKFGFTRKGPGVFESDLLRASGASEPPRGPLSVPSAFIGVIAREDRHNVSKYREPEAQHLTPQSSR